MADVTIHRTGRVLYRISDELACALVEIGAATYGIRQDPTNEAVKRELGPQHERWFVGKNASDTPCIYYKNLRTTIPWDGPWDRAAEVFLTAGLHCPSEIIAQYRAETDPVALFAGRTSRSEAEIAAGQAAQRQQQRRTPEELSAALRAQAQEQNNG